jgi:hypothetical protein
MQTLTVVDTGLSYMQACLEYYLDGGAFFLLYAAALLFILIAGTKREQQIFLPSAALLLLTVYNPIFPVVLNQIFDVNKEYYRFFWIAPTVIVIPYVCTRLIMMQDKKVKRIVFAVAMFAILCLSGSYIYAEGYTRTENAYKIPDELIEISEIIHEDASVDYPRVLMEYNYNMEMRQYDPSILLTIDREDYLYVVSQEYTQEMLDDEAFPQYKLLELLIRHGDISEEAFKQALEQTKTEYMVVSTDNAIRPFFEQAGFRVVAQTENHTVFHYELEEPEVFELIDYSGLR